MSGHSHFATIKRQKESKDAAKGKIFSKMARAISIAVKSGGGPDPDSNYKLRMAIDAAKAVNTPKENIDRAINKASTEAQDIDEVTYEGFGPRGIGVVIDAATNNRNRTSQEIKNLFEKYGGNMGGPGSVSFNFEQKGLIIVEKSSDIQEQILTIIDLGAEDVNEAGNELEVFVNYQDMSKIADEIKKVGFNVSSSRLIKKAKTLIEVSDENSVRKIIDFIEKLDEHDDVQEVYTNVDINPTLLDKMSN